MRVCDCRSRWVTGAAAIMFAIMPAAPVAQTAKPATDLVGTYDSGEPEIAAGLELGADGRFRYGLSYGALDEQAAGTWRVDGERVLLTSDPVTPPRFVLVGQRRLPAGQLQITLDVPKGMSRQYFDVAIHFADGTVTEQQLSDEPGPLRLQSGRQPASVTVSLGMFDIGSAPLALAGTDGHDLQVRFEPNDLGKVAFVQTPLVREGDDLILMRHDRAIHFRKAGR